jgi:predicted ATPase
VTKAQAGFSALKESIPQLKDAMKEVGGINDVKSAMKEEGVLKAIQEGGKAVTRVATSLGLAIVGTCTPIPAGTFAGWVAGEKLVNTCLGKPFTKQAKNILK